MVSPAVRAGIERRLKELGMKPIDDDQKEVLKLQRTTFLGQRDRLDARIAALQQEIQALKGKSGEGRPAIPGAEYVHGKYPLSGCGMKTAIYYTTTPQGGAAGGDYVYYCLFCDKEFM